MWGDTIIYLNHLKRKPINKEKNEFSKCIKGFVKFKRTLFLTYVKKIHQKNKNVYLAALDILLLLQFLDQGNKKT